MSASTYTGRPDLRWAFRSPRKHPSERAPRWRPSRGQADPGQGVADRYLALLAASDRSLVELLLTRMGFRHVQGCWSPKAGLIFREWASKDIDLAALDLSSLADWAEDPDALLNQPLGSHRRYARGQIRKEVTERLKALAEQSTCAESP